MNRGAPATQSPAAQTPGAVVRTEWNTDAIWLRRTFELENTDFTNLQLRIHHDEEAEITINGHEVSDDAAYRPEYIDRSIRLRRRGGPILKIGTNTLTIHYRQTGGGQYIDAGLANVIEQTEK